MDSMLTRLTDSVRVLRGSRREQKTALLGGAFFAAIALLQQLPWGASYQAGATWVAAGLGALFLALTLKRLWGLSLAPPAPREATGGAAIKGAGSFTPEDAELFSRLGRLKELKQLRSWVVDRHKVPVVAVMGESGVGKTSLLRAGLDFILGQGEQPIPFAYWEASPLGARASLLRAVEAQLGTRVLGTLPPSVIVVDQLEQLSPERNPDFFELLREHLDSEPPFRVTWALAFRREFGSTWLDFLHELPEHCRHRPQLLSLQRFTPQQAREVFATLAEEAEIPVRDSLLVEILHQLTEDGSISPVDVGITLQVLQRQPGIAEDPAAFRSVGGPAGLLTLYLDVVLEPYTPLLREEVLRSLLALVDEDEDRRLADGRQLDELREIARPQVPHHLDVALEALSQPGVRVLERVEETPRKYRLIHERFIPALRRLAGELLSKEDRASRLLERRFQLWEREECQARYLLPTLELREILAHRGALRWGRNRDGKLRYLERSCRRWRTRRIVAGISGVLIALGSFAAIQLLEVQAAQKEMFEWGLPKGSYEILPHVTDLAVPQVSNTLWLMRAESLRNLFLSLAPQYRAEGAMAWPASLDQLTLELAEASPLELPPNLEQLTLDLRGYQGSSLPELPASLKQLSLDLSLSAVVTGARMTSVPELPAGLEQLSLRLSASRITSVPELPAGLKHLSLDLTASRILTVPDLPADLEQLSLSLSDSRVTSLPELPAGLKQFTLDFTIFDPGLSGSEITSLPELPAGLQRLAFVAGESQVAHLPELPAGLEQLSLDLSGSQVTSVPDLPTGLEQLSLDLSHTEVPSLRDLPEFLEQLALSGSQISSLPDLPVGLQELTLDFASFPMTILADLPSRPPQLTLNFGYSRVERLAELPAGLLQITLDLRDSHVNSLPELPVSVEQLTVVLRGSRVRSLPELPAGLQQLTLDLEGSEVSSLPELPAGLQQVTLVLSDSQVGSVSELPMGLKELTLDLSFSDVRQVPELPAGLEQLSLDLRNSAVTSLPELPSAMQCIALELSQGAALVLVMS